MGVYGLETYFPCHTGTQISLIIQMAENEVFQRRNLEIRIEHLVLGYMRFIEIYREIANYNTPNYEILPWFMPTKVYSRKSQINKFKISNTCENMPNVHKDVKAFSDLYKMYESDMNIETFYLLLLNARYYSKNLTTRPFVPRDDVSLEDIMRPFDEILKNHKAYLPRNHKEDFIDNYFMKEFFGNQIVCEESSKKANSNDSEYKNEDNFTIQVDTKSDSIFRRNNSEFSEPVNIDMTSDITNKAFKGKTKLVIGREYEIGRMIDILCKKDRNNVVLIGESGVGKTAIIEALARRIVDGNIPEKLKRYHILRFDTASSIAGTRYRGDFEEKIKKFIDSLKNCPHQIILYIDQIEEIVGLGSIGECSFSLSDMLKPLLSTSDVKIIGTSTFGEYRRVEKDKSLRRRFRTITVNPPSFEETETILEKIKFQYEDEFGVTIPNDTIKATIILSERYITESYLPDKAIDILDETCSIKTRNLKINRKEKIEITKSDVMKCISEETGIPINKINTSFKMENVEQYLNSQVIGQEHVSKIIAKAIMRSQMGLNDENRPLASFMFVGPTGVGKTEIAKALSDFVFSGKHNMIRFDMSEYMEENSVSKLIGSPPGYIGYDDPGLLTEKVRRYPYSLVLFDEFEKAHNKVWNLLLQVLDEGCLTDSKGECVNFKNTIIIMTSNVGAKEYSKKTVGFGQDNNSDTRHDISEEIKKKFAPEFLNRLDEVIQFNQLSKEDIRAITKLNLEKSILKKLEARGINVDISDEVIDKIAEIGYSQEYGARELQRTISREIKDRLADFLLQNETCNFISINLVEDNIVVGKAGVPAFA